MVVKPSEQEEEYFARLDFEKRKKWRKRNIKDCRGRKEEAQGAALHEMPQVRVDLIEVDYKGIKVDKCVQCSGLWLDAGELETVAKQEKTFLDNLFSFFTESDQK